jgi:hypothetical protein
MPIHEQFSESYTPGQSYLVDGDLLNRHHALLMAMNNGRGSSGLEGFRSTLNADISGDVAIISIVRIMANEKPTAGCSSDPDDPSGVTGACPDKGQYPVLPVEYLHTFNDWDRDTQLGEEYWQQLDASPWETELGSTGIKIPPGVPEVGERVTAFWHAVRERWVPLWWKQYQPEIEFELTESLTHGMRRASARILEQHGDGFKNPSSDILVINPFGSVAEHIFRGRSGQMGVAAWSQNNEYLIENMECPRDA